MPQKSRVLVTFKLELGRLESLTFHGTSYLVEKRSSERK